MIYILEQNLGDADDPQSNKITEDDLLKWCQILFRCAGRATADGQQLLKANFLRFTALLGDRLNSLPDPAGAQWPPNVFRWQCVLDMTMRLHKRVPGIIDRSLFEPLHVRSVKLFHLVVEGLWLERIQKRPKDSSQKQDALKQKADWEKVLETGEYAEVEVRNEGEYTEYQDKWDYQRLRIDCKHRIEFLLNYWGLFLPEAFQEFQF